MTGLQEKLRELVRLAADIDTGPSEFIEADSLLIILCRDVLTEADRIDALLAKLTGCRCGPSDRSPEGICKKFSHGSDHTYCDACYHDYACHPMEDGADVI